MTTEKTSAQVINLPYQLASKEELSDCDDINVLSYQLRIHGVEQIRLIQIGRLQATENVVQNLKNINGLLEEFGKPTLSLDFLQ